MGTLSHHRAANRFQTALQQRLEAASDPNAAQQAYDDALEALISIAIDEVELDRAARALATDPDAIDFPETNAQSHSNSTSESQP
jgi:hypothetical protein